MQPDAFRKLSQYRVTEGPLRSNPGFGNNGAFRLPVSLAPPDQVTLLPPAHTNPHFIIWAIISDMDGWDHVSAHVQLLPSMGLSRTHMTEERRTPTWTEMCFVKSLFFDPEETVMQLHPKASKYINCHPHVLHLWRPHNRSIPMPEASMV